jgi:hypothetical protein
MNTSEVSMVPLQQATLCIDCDMITSSQTRCFACGSVALMSLARTLNGVDDNQEEEVGQKVVAVASAAPRVQPEMQGFRSVQSHRRPPLPAQNTNIQRVFLSLLNRHGRRRLSSVKYGT